MKWLMKDENLKDVKLKDILSSESYTQLCKIIVKNKLQTNKIKRIEIEWNFIMKELTQQERYLSDNYIKLVNNKRHVDLLKTTRNQIETLRREAGNRERKLKEWTSLSKN